MGTYGLDSRAALQHIPHVQCFNFTASVTRLYENGMLVAEYS